MNDEILFSSADEDCIPLLKELWLRCFPEDRPQDVDRFYDALFSTLVCLIGTVGGRPVTMLHLLPAHAYVRGEAFPVRYLYAGCTHPEHRHRGYYVALLQYAQTYVTGMGECGIYLHPATEALIPLYERAGYVNCIVSGLPRRFNGIGSLLSVTAADYAKLRQTHIRRLKCDYAYFEPEPMVSELFLSASMRDETLFYSDGVRILVVRDGMILDSLPPETTTHFTAMWIKIGEARPLSKAMGAHGGYTALLGE